MLLDFGAARDFTLEDDSPAEYGTDGYMPPERATAGERGLAAGRQADVFALGVILVEAMIGQRLSQEEINAHKERVFGALIHSATLPAAFVDAVLKALAYDPRRRYPSAQEMLDDLLVIAPPVGRVDRRFLDFGRVELGVPLRRRPPMQRGHALPGRRVRLRRGELPGRLLHRHRLQPARHPHLRPPRRRVRRVRPGRHRSLRERRLPLRRFVALRERPALPRRHLRLRRHLVPDRLLPGRPVPGAGDAFPAPHGSAVSLPPFGRRVAAPQWVVRLSPRRHR